MKSTLWLMIIFLVSLAAHAPLVCAAPFVLPRTAECVAMSPDGELVAIGRSGLSNSEFPPRPHPNPRKTGVVEVWEVKSSRRLRRWETYGDITKLEFVSGKPLLAAARWYKTSDGLQLNEVRVWNIKTNKTELVFDRCHHFALSPSGEHIAVLSRRKCVEFQLEGGARIREIPLLAGATSICFGPQGKHLMATLCEDGHYQIRVVDARNLARVSESLPTTFGFYRVAVSPDGRQLATGHADGTILLWDRQSLQVRRRFQALGKGWQHPFFSPEGDFLASGSQRNGDVSIWELTTGNQVYRYTFQRGSLRTYFTRARDEQHRPESDPQRFVFSPDGQAFLSGCHGGLLRLVSTGQDVRRFVDN